MTMFGKSAVLCSVFLLGWLPAMAQSAGGADATPQAVRGRGQGGGRRGSGVRGTVASVQGANVAVKDEQGDTWTIVTTENTRILRGREPLAFSAIQPGDEVFSMGVPDTDKHELHAMMLMDVPAAEVAKARANLGKTYIAGRVTAMEETKLTILRTDHIAQTILLDESTSLHRGGRIDASALQAAGLDSSMMGMGGMGGRRRAEVGGNAEAPNPGGESITLADVKVGDTVVGVGAVKGGFFVPSDLHVQERSAGQHRGANGEAPPPAQ